MSTDLVVWVSSRLESDHKLSDEAKLLILAALEGRSALADMAGYSAPVVSLEQADEVEPAGAFLKQIKVRGFRGIGPSTQLDLDPFPSLAGDLWPQRLRQIKSRRSARACPDRDDLPVARSNRSVEGALAERPRRRHHPH